MYNIIIQKRTYIFLLEKCVNYGWSTINPLSVKGGSVLSFRLRASLYYPSKTQENLLVFKFYGK